jgi:hypothetical protein
MRETKGMYSFVGVFFWFFFGQLVPIFSGSKKEQKKSLILHLLLP